jgi:hypothetical protein
MKYPSQCLGMNFKQAKKIMTVTETTSMMASVESEDVEVSIGVSTFAFERCYLKLTSIHIACQRTVCVYCKLSFRGHGRRAVQTFRAYSKVGTETSDVNKECRCNWRQTEDRQ